VPSFYHHPKTIEDIIDQTIGKIFDYFGIEHDLFQRWSGDQLTEDAEKALGHVGKGKGIKSEVVVSKRGARGMRSDQTLPI
jgi:4-hydroxy-3-polyprenylbenzoate decarboxylase